MNALRVAAISVFPRMFDVLREGGIAARAITDGLLEVVGYNPRDYALNKHRQVDDRPYGGGPGMVMQVEPIRRAIAAARTAFAEPCHVVALSPQGEALDQARVADLVARRNLVLVCGRYEGIDERLLEFEVDQELSVGDYVLSGGEFAALVVIDAMARLLPGALGHADSAAQDSFANGLLDCPHFTRPEIVDGRRVPAVLMGGDHEAIRTWRLKQSLARTWSRRPDLLERLDLTDEQQRLLREIVAEQGGAD